MAKGKRGGKVYRVIRVILPPLVYFLIQNGVILLAEILWIREAYRLPGTDFAGYGSAEALARHMIYSNYLHYALVSAVFSIILMTVLREKDEEKRAWRLVREEDKAKYCLIILLLGGASVAGNLIINRTGITETSEGFQELQELLSGGSEYMILLCVGFIIPICEELVFRGLVYMRLRDMMRPGWAMMISAFIFALVHGNLPQGIFAFGLGLLLAYVYERYGNIAAPCLGHISANILSAVGAQLYDAPMPQFLAFSAVSVILMLVVLFRIRKTIRGGAILKRRAPETAG